MGLRRAAAEFVGTFVLVSGGVGAAVIAGDKIGNYGIAFVFAGIPIGLVLTLIHLVGIPVDGTSVNPARSIGPAIFVGGWALSQIWLFIVAPLLGAGRAPHRSSVSSDAGLLQQQRILPSGGGSSGSMP